MFASQNTREHRHLRGRGRKKINQKRSGARPTIDASDFIQIEAVIRLKIREIILLGRCPPARVYHCRRWPRTSPVTSYETCELSKFAERDRTMRRTQQPENYERSYDRRATNPGRRRRSDDVASLSARSEISRNRAARDAHASRGSAEVSDADKWK